MPIPTRYPLALLITLTAVLAGCSRTRVLPYHSTASIPHYSASTATSMTLALRDDRTDRFRRFGVAAAVDDDGTAYVLLVPAVPGRRAVRDLDDALVSRGAPLPLEKAGDLASGLARVLLTWGTPQTNGSGEFYEFLHAPEQDIDQVSENVHRWTPSVQFHYSHTSNGPRALLSLGDGEATYAYEMERESEVRDLMHLVREAIDEAAP